MPNRGRRCCLYRVLTPFFEITYELVEVSFFCVHNCVFEVNKKELCRQVTVPVSIIRKRNMLYEKLMLSDSANRIRHRATKCVSLFWCIERNSLIQPGKHVLNKSDVARADCYDVQGRRVKPGFKLWVFFRQLRITKPPSFYGAVAQVLKIFSK